MKIDVRAVDLRQVFPTRWLVVLIGIGFIELFVTAILHANGSIVELNPLMRPLIEQSEWLFAFVKAFTLLAAWVVLAWYAKQNLGFVRKTCCISAAAYFAIWCGWFLASA